MSNGRQVEAEQTAVSNDGFHFFDIFLYASHPVAIEPKLVHRLQHARMHEITLEGNVIVMTNIIWLRRKHFH